VSRPDDIIAAIRSDLGGLPSSRTPAVRGVRRRYARGLGSTPPDVVVAVADGLLREGGWPERVVATELLVGRPDALERVTAAMVERWSRDLVDWGNVHLFGVTVAGVAWRTGRLTDARVMAWTRSPDRWRRRLALVATVPLNSRARGGAGDAARTLPVCRALAADRDDMVVKALSWALRELAKRDPMAVRRFLREEGRRLAPRVIREVTSTLETGRRS